MRRVTLALATLLVLAAPSAALAKKPDEKGDKDKQGEPVALERQGIGVGALMSPNVRYLGTLANEFPAVGADFARVDKRWRMYVTGHKGISIYDVENPTLPLLLGHLPFPHSQNEDVEVSEDGSRLLIAADGSSFVPTEINGGTHLFDVSDPANIRKVASHPVFNHTVECADAACEWIYGQKGGIYQAGEDSLVLRGSWKPRVGGRTDWPVHALYRDGAGYMISDSTPRFVLDVTDPANPVALASGRPGADDRGSIQHNGVRPNADRWRPRDPASPDFADPALRPGELFIGGSERNQHQDCANAGGLSTWSMANFDRGEPLRQLQVVRPERGSAWEGGNPPANVLGCSSHWFSYRDGLVAAGWFEHGTRFFEVDESSGAIEQVGWFNPVWTSASASHWLPGPNGKSYVFTVDYARGIDLLEFDRKGPKPSKKKQKDSWSATRAGGASRLAERERYVCALAVRG